MASRNLKNYRNKVSFSGMGVGQISFAVRFPDRWRPQKRNSASFRGFLDMGKRGPRKKLSAIEALEGNPSKRLIEESGVEALGEPFIAEHLMDDARGCIEVIKASMPASVYSALDSFHLAAFAMAWAVHKKAALEISNPDFSWIVTNSAGSETQSPWIKMMNNQAAILASLGDRLGLDPKSRAALKLPGAKQKKSKFAGLLGQNGSSPSLSN